MGIYIVINKLTKAKICAVKALSHKQAKLIYYATNGSGPDVTTKYYANTLSNTVGILKDFHGI